MKKILALVAVLILLSAPNVIAQATVSVSLKPDAITVPGGTMGFQSTVINNSDETQIVYFATNITLPDGNTYPPSGYLVGPIKVTLGSYESKSKRISHDMPVSAPLGAYTYHAYIHKQGVGIIGVDEFDFEVVAPAPVEKTGQTTSYEDYDDGWYQKGVAWPSPRFTDNGVGTVTDNLTGLIWLKNADCFGTRTWYEALTDCNSLASGSCGLYDGSTTGDWRLPNVNELQSLIDYSQINPVLPSAHPFDNVQSYYYWSSTTYESNTSNARSVNMDVGYVISSNKYGSNYVWPVHGGQ